MPCPCKLQKKYDATALRERDPKTLRVKKDGAQIIPKKTVAMKRRTVQLHPGYVNASENSRWAQGGFVQSDAFQRHRR